MAKIYTAQEKYDIYAAALDLNQALIEISKNPGILKVAAQDLVEASQMTAEKKLEFEAAQTTLADAKRATDDLNEKQADYAAEVERVNKQLHLRTVEADDVSASLDKKKAAFEADERNRLAKLEHAEAGFVEAQAALNDKIKDAATLNKSLKAFEDRLDKREAALAAREAVLADGEAKHAIKKKKLLEATKDD